MKEIARKWQQIKVLSAMEMKNKQDIDRWWNEAEQAKAGQSSAAQRAESVAAEMKTLQSKHDALQIKYLKLEERYQALQREQSETGRAWRQWGTEEVLQWILQLAGGKFKKYRAALAVNVETENIDGTCLRSLDKGDVHRLGVTDFKDKTELLAHIEALAGPKREE